jgi:uncharacterized membrane protein YeaQ/YmgE (transglycosylase-associated protein family)
MDRKKLVMLGTVVGGYAGGYIPLLWGAGTFSFSGLLFSALGSCIGIWLGFQLGE